MVKGLTELQNELKAPKNLFNSFGKYAYRNAEAILEAVKPLLAKYKLQQTVSDKIVMVGDRYYLVATVTVTDGTESVSVEGWARESTEKKGMDDSQITGTASSYARKYALNGMYAIDDTKDADTDEFHAQTTTKYASKEDKKAFQDVCEKAGVNPVELLEKVGWKKGEATTEEQLGKAKNLFAKTVNAKDRNK